MQEQLIERMKTLRLRGMASALEESLTALGGQHCEMRTPYRRAPGIFSYALRSTYFDGDTSTGSASFQAGKPPAK